MQGLFGLNMWQRAETIELIFNTTANRSPLRPYAIQVFLQGYTQMRRRRVVGYDADDLDRIGAIPGFMQSAFEAMGDAACRSSYYGGAYYGGASPCYHTYPASMYMVPEALGQGAGGCLNRMWASLTSRDLRLRQ